eukprot:4667583-Amphidinium_carterae.1
MAVSCHRGGSSNQDGSAQLIITSNTSSKTKQLSWTLVHAWLLLRLLNGDPNHKLTPNKQHNRENARRNELSNNPWLIARPSTMKGYSVAGIQCCSCLDCHLDAPLACKGHRFQFLGFGHADIHVGKLQQGITKLPRLEMLPSSVTPQNLSETNPVTKSNKDCRPLHASPSLNVQVVLRSSSLRLWEGV